MPTALAYATHPQPLGSVQICAPGLAANDNSHLHLISDNTNSHPSGAIAGENRSLGYDGRGNVTSLGGLGMGYDLSDQPTSVSGTASGTYRYDGHKRRVKSVVAQNGISKTIYNVYNAAGQLVVIDNVTTGEKTDYVHAGGKTIARLVNSVPTYLHSDHLGSASTGTSSNGTVAWRELYSPFGETLNNISANNDRDGFTGHIKDSATGLNYMQARYYDPLIGRFLSIDPVGFSPGSPGSFNRYAYTFNDPINGIDPDGREKVGLQVSGEGFFLGGFKLGVKVTYDTETGQVQASSLFAPGIGIGGGLDSPLVVEASDSAPVDVGSSTRGSAVAEGNIGPFSAKKVISEKIDGQKVDTGKTETGISGPEMKQDSKGKFKPQIKVSGSFSAEVEKTFTSPDIRLAMNDAVDKVKDFF